MGLIDLGAMDLPFTWYNKKIDSGAIFERLDRVLSNLPIAKVIFF